MTAVMTTEVMMTVTAMGAATAPLLDLVRDGFVFECFELSGSAFLYPGAWSPRGGGRERRVHFFESLFGVVTRLPVVTVPPAFPTTLPTPRSEKGAMMKCLALTRMTALMPMARNCRDDPLPPPLPTWLARRPT